MAQHTMAFINQEWQALRFANFNDRQITLLHYDAETNNVVQQHQPGQAMLNYMNLRAANRASMIQEMENEHQIAESHRAYDLARQPLGPVAQARSSAFIGVEGVLAGIADVDGRIAFLETQLHQLETSQHDVLEPALQIQQDESYYRPGNPPQQPDPNHNVIIDTIDGLDASSRRTRLVLGDAQGNRLVDLHGLPNGFAVPQGVPHPPRPHNDLQYVVAGVDPAYSLPNNPVTVDEAEKAILEEIGANSWPRASEVLLAAFSALDQAAYQAYTQNLVNGAANCPGWDSVQQILQVPTRWFAVTFREHGGTGPVLANEGPFFSPGFFNGNSFGGPLGTYQTSCLLGLNGLQLSLAQLWQAGCARVMVIMANAFFAEACTNGDYVPSSTSMSMAMGVCFTPDAGQQTTVGPIRLTHASWPQDDGRPWKRLEV